MPGRDSVIPLKRRRAPVVVPALVILIGMALRFATLGLDVRFHPDEALFAAQARLISHQGDWLLRGTDLDKPPLTFYVTAFSYRILGPTEFAARLPNVLFSSLSLALVYALAWMLYRDRVTAALTALLIALSPYDLAFAATAFTDIQATCWVLAAAWLAVCDRWTYAGIAAALIFAARLNALIMLPLILALGIAHNVQPGWRGRDILRRLGQLAWPLAIGISLLVIWDMGRAPRSFFDLGYTRGQPGRFIRSDELWPRLERWGHWLGFITGSRVLNRVLLVAGPVYLAAGALRPRSRAAAADWLIAGFGLAFLAWHWLIAFNTYDRYIHSLVPFLALLAGRALAGVWRAVSGSLSNLDFRRPGKGGRAAESVPVVLAILIAAAVLPATRETLRGAMPIGGDQGQHTGIDALAAYINTHLEGEVIYDHWLGWELAYYLGERLQVSVLYSPMPEALADDMAQQARARYFAAPSAQIAAPWLDALQRAGVKISTVYHDTENGFVIYRLSRQESSFLD